MTTGLDGAEIVRVIREQGEGGWFYATSPDLRGLLVTQPTLDRLDDTTPQAIMDLYTARGLHVILARLEGNNRNYRSWVAIPTALAAQAISQEEARRASFGPSQGPKIP